MGNIEKLKCWLDKIREQKDRNDAIVKDMENSIKPLLKEWYSAKAIIIRLYTTEMDHATNSDFGILFQMEESDLRAFYTEICRYYKIESHAKEMCEKCKRDICPKHPVDNSALERYYDTRFRVKLEYYNGNLRVKEIKEV